MSKKREGKKPNNTENAAQEVNAPKVVPVKFKGFDLTHNSDCKCNQETIDTLENLLIEFGFVEVPCKYSEESGVPEHPVFIPENFETTCWHCKLRVFLVYATFAEALYQAGLYKNAERAYGCIEDYVTKGADGKSYFHANFEDVPWQVPEKVGAPITAAA